MPSHPNHSSSTSSDPKKSIAKLSADLQRLLEVLNAEEPNAKISIPALAAFLRWSQVKLRTALQDLIGHCLLRGSIRDNTLHLREHRIICQGCGVEYSNPSRYYTCDICYQPLCHSCSKQKSVIQCSHHPDQRSRMVRMPLKCPYCKTQHLTLQCIHDNDLRCPACNTKFFFH